MDLTTLIHYILVNNRYKLLQIYDLSKIKNSLFPLWTYMYNRKITLEIVYTNLGGLILQR